MPDIMDSLFNIKTLDDLACKGSFIHRIHPLVKLITTVVYLTVVISFDRYEVSGLLPLFFYPVIVLALADLPAVPILKRVMFAAPLIIGIGILNPVFDRQVVIIGGIALSRGWLTFLSICLKCGLTVTAALLLIAFTGMDKLARALRMLKVLRLFVLQLLLTYRYTLVLTEEVARTLRAYSLRAPGQKGVGRNVWGSLVGQLLLRTFERAQRIYQAMCLKGFTGEYNTGDHTRVKAVDIAYLSGWVLIFALARACNIPVLLGKWITEVVR